MSDFLARLADRALGIAQMVKPVIEPAFAAFPSNGFEDHPSGVAAPDADPLAVGPTAATPSIERLVRDRVQLQDRDRQRIIEPRPARAENTATVSTDIAAAHQETAVDRATPPLAIASAPPSHVDDIPPHLTAALTARSTLPEPGEKASYGLIAAPPPSAHRSQRRLQPQAAAAAETPQIVRVTIGRIDVRAEVASPPPARAASRKPENRGLSLDDYLKQRAEGRR
jgi:hypothetical protein